MSVSLHAKRKKTLPRLRGGSGPGFDLLLAVKVQSVIAWWAPRVLTLVDGSQLRISRVSIKVKDWPPISEQCTTKLCPD